MIEVKLHGAAGFTRNGANIIEKTATCVFPSGWGSIVTNRDGRTAKILLFRPDGSQYSDEVDYSEVVLEDEGRWWERTLRRALSKGLHRVLSMSASVAPRIHEKPTTSLSPTIRRPRTREVRSK
jgi:hypothetical protein